MNNEDKKYLEEIVSILESVDFRLKVLQEAVNFILSQDFKTYTEIQTDKLIEGVEMELKEKDKGIKTFDY